MHHSDHQPLEAIAVTCYLDESGIDKNSPITVVAGFLLNKDSLVIFDSVWEHILSKHGIDPPLHMKEFGEHGRFGHLRDFQRRDLFDQIAKLINSYKVHSVAMSISQSSYLRIVDHRIRKHMSPYGACFMGCAHLVSGQANYSYYSRNIAYLLEAVSEHAGQIRVAHQEMLNLQKQGKMSNIGSLAFGDKNISALQAADVIAWGERRRRTGLSIAKGFEPIATIFNEYHLEHSWQNEWLHGLNDAILRNKEGNKDN